MRPIVRGNPGRKYKGGIVGFRYGIDSEKAEEVLSYVAVRCNDTYHALKIIYFADRDHLSKYGRLIYGDSYIAFKSGPVPYWARRATIVPGRDANMDMMSESDVECLDIAIAKYGNMPVEELKRLSQDDAYYAADENDCISVESIALTLPDGELLLEYWQS